MKTSPVRDTVEPQPLIRSEIFSIERLEQHAETLAAAQTVSTRTEAGRALLPRVVENGRVLLEYYRSLARSAEKDLSITPAAEWLLDNFYVVEEQLREIRDDLPAGYYRKLPKLASGHLQGYPRVYGIAWAFVAHSDSRFEAETFRRFLMAYQRVQPLTIGELWAVAITLRIVLVENLRRITEQIVSARGAREEADKIADALSAAGEHVPDPATGAIRQMEKRRLSRAFVVQLIQRLRDLDPKVAPVVQWLEAYLSNAGQTVDEVVRAEHQDQAGTTVTVRNVITSMRMMSSFDWQEFFESVSLVDEALRVGTDFAAMDFSTRDSYRHAIEDLARGSRRPEVEVAKRAVVRSRYAKAEVPANGRPPNRREADPGYYLISHGREDFEHGLGFRLPLRRRLLRLYVRAAVPGYLGTVGVVTALILASPIMYTRELNVPVAVQIFLGLLAAIPASDLAISLVNRGVTDLLDPLPLPRLELKEGIPEEMRTLVAVPCLLTSVAEIKEQIDRLEVHYLGNADGDLSFGLVSDWVDAKTETLEADDELLAAAVERITELNRRYGPRANGEARFFLFHRRRVWNESQQSWMGWERKRGKLHELNQLLRGSRVTTFMPLGGAPAPEKPSGVRYVITLDADTRLPRGAAARLVGTMAHPLNQPAFSKDEGRVVDGYGIVQPRITPSLPENGAGSFYQRVFSGPSGIDPYAFAVSDVYQDLFHEGSYTGKGIYDLDAFEAAMEGKIPENTLLSHDLLEGIFVRCALASDIELFEEYPSHYETSASRHHRWARGDWQLLPWLFGFHRPPADRPFRIPVISWWKMFDNLRRSLSSPAMFLLLLLGWLLPGASPWMWVVFVFATVAIPALLPFFAGLTPRLGGISKRSHLRDLLSDLTLGLERSALTISFLAHQAWLMVDAIVRTLWRMFVSHRNLLQWVSAAQAKWHVDLELVSMYIRMASGVVLGCVALLVVALFHPRALPIALPFALLWLASPAIAQWISYPPPLAEAEEVSPEDTAYFREVARRTWLFFETFVTEDDHYLPPDNFQEDPVPRVAHRTSATNIGLYLLATAAARDFGWMGTQETLGRIEATLDTLKDLALFRGHFYNWYNTQTLAPLEPRYISTVDSGNLAGHLLTVGNACRQFIQSPILRLEAFEGARDCIRLLREALRRFPETPRAHGVTHLQLAGAVDAFASALEVHSTEELYSGQLFSELRSRAAAIADLAQAFVEERGLGVDMEVKLWAEKAHDCIESHFLDARLVIPWLLIESKETLGGEWPTRRTPEWSVVEAVFAKPPTLEEAPEYYERALAELARLRSPLLSDPDPNKEALARIDSIAAILDDAVSEVVRMMRRLRHVGRRADEMFSAMDFAFLFDESRKLFSIGYNVVTQSLDASCYDLLASEARLSSFLAIAKSEVPAQHWFRLSRPLTPVGNGSALISWSGSMFEYLMPAIVMHSPPGSLLSQTGEQVVRRQIEYGSERGVPWGISESAFNARDLDLTYQYQAFGVPGLGLKRGLSQDLVIAPYATALASMVDAPSSAANLRRMETLGGKGKYGFYDALDFTSSRLPEGEDVAVVRTYMAHHEGMSLVAWANVLTKSEMQKRFHAQSIVQATELLLQERTPRDVLVARPRAEEVVAAQVRDILPPTLRKFDSPHDVVPRTQVLSNGSYSVLLTAAGSGYSRYNDFAVTRWREDVTRDCWGTFVFLRDEQTGNVWSAGYQPTAAEPDEYSVTFYDDHADFTRRDRSLMTTLEVVISAEDNVEMRRAGITNLGARAKTIQVTSYAEVVIAPQAADEAHPAFSNLFVQTEFLSDIGALVASRRKRNPDEPSLCVAHLLAVNGETVGELEYETDRMRFLGRGRTVRSPISIMDGHPLTNTTGSVLDPVMSLRRTVRVPPGGTVHLYFSTLVAPSRDEILELADKYRDPRIFDRTMTLAWTHSQVQLHHFGISLDEAYLFQKLANSVLFPDRRFRPSSDLLSQTPIRRETLWAQGISGDLPIVLARIDDVADIDLIRQLLRAHSYWRMRRLPVDIVILNEKPTSYLEDLQSSLDPLVRAAQSNTPSESDANAGRVFLLRADRLSPEARSQLQAIARVVLLSRRGLLAEQVARSQAPEEVAIGSRAASRSSRRQDVLLSVETPEPSNGFGSFVKDGREYLIVLREGSRTPEVWSNVVANPTFGFLATESGSGFTWCVNSHENQLTPWTNDHVTDTPGEAIYIRDEVSGEVWTPTALPIRDEAGTYVIRHGQGYSRFQHGSRGILLDLLQFVPSSDPVKISRLTLRNESGRARRISVTAYAEWVLGSSRGANAPYIVTEIDPQSRALFARSLWQGEFAGRVAFADLRGKQTSYTADRTEFLGRNGAYESPSALEKGAKLSGAVGTGLDPCAALQTGLDLKPGESAEVVFFLGQGDDAAAAREIVRRYRSANLDEVFRAVEAEWDGILGAVQVDTPDAAMNPMLNRWLLYQTLSSRIWARAAFYQLSGAYGFRDQLQDVLALLVPKRGIARDHICRAASRQFVEGDVQHWWHPPGGRGIRTRISDDALWLPYAVIQFVEATEDHTILEETIPFLEGEILAEGQDESYFQPRRSQTSATLYEHCARILDRSLGLGPHGLPLMGTGDWNDGMNRVGRLGRGESIWLGWFLHTILWEFSKLADARNQRDRGERWRLHVIALKAAIEREGWDGEWYRRAYFDDGTPLGSAANAQCRIDSIAQSWAVITGGGEPSRARRSIEAVDRHLILRPQGLSLLLNPPFDHPDPDPGYISGYVPGVRENGGQYTHAAVWNLIAFTSLGEGDKAGELFRMLNPASRTSSRAGIQRYKVEPYAMAGDVYAEGPHVGRGGWTWYTGSAGWLYRAGIESMLGFRVRGAELWMDPCIPRNWDRYSMRFRYHSSTYQITVENPSSVCRGVVMMELDGHRLPGSSGVTLADDGATHTLRVLLG